jgi:hypothetical protein
MRLWKWTSYIWAGNIAIWGWVFSRTTEGSALFMLAISIAMTLYSVWRYEYERKN